MLILTVLLGRWLYCRFFGLKFCGQQSSLFWRQKVNLGEFSRNGMETDGVNTPAQYIDGYQNYRRQIFLKKVWIRVKCSIL
jgi:hypothetical protein